MKLMTAKEATKTGLVPLSVHTIYKAHHLKQHPEIFFKVGGKLMVDLDAYLNMAESARDAHVKKAARMKDVA